MKIFTSLFLLLFFVSLQAQDSGCDGQRYITPIFDDTEVDNNVSFGQNTTLGGELQELFMDIHEPVGDDLEQRPLVILAHGGAFLAGERDEFTSSCIELAKRGYVAATIDYRLIDQLVFDSVGFTEGVVLAIHDMKAAIRFFREDAATNNLYRIDPNMIIVGGASAGAVTAVHAGYFDENDVVPDYIQGHLDAHGGFEGNSSENSDTYTSEVQGVLNYSGSILRLNWVDANGPPLYSGHDEFDPVVPCDYNTSNLFFFDLYSYGSCEITTRAEDLGIRNEFYLVEESDGHVSFLQDDNLPTVMAESFAFVEEIICGNITSTGEPQARLNWMVYPNPSQGQINIKINNPASSKQVRIFDAAGQLLQQFISSNQNTSLDLPAGLYYVQLDGETQKLVVMPRS